MALPAFLTRGVLTAIIILAVQACSPVYNPQFVNVPLVRSRSEASLGVHAGATGVHANGTLAFIRPVYAQFGLSACEFLKSSTAAAEGGLGIFRRFHAFVPSLGAGFGVGGADSWVYRDSLTGLGMRHVDSAHLQADYSKFYLQPNALLDWTCFQLGASYKLSYMHLNSKSLSRDVGYRLGSGPVQEIAFTAALGTKGFKLVGQLGASAPSRSIARDEGQILLSLGLMTQFGR